MMRDTATVEPLYGQTVPNPAVPLRARLVHLAFVWAALMTMFGVLIPEQFTDPFIRSDDYPALFPKPELFYWKTLAEGRWVNWIWMLRPWPTDPQVLWFLYIALWALASALVGIGVFARARWPVGALLLGLAFALAPQVAMIANWFNTMIPATAILTLHAGVAVFGSARAARIALCLGVPLMLMCHTGYPFLMLAIHAAVARPEGGWRETLSLMVWFTGALMAGLLLIYGLNWAVHGHFGIRLAVWRDARPIADLSDVLRNLGVLRDWARQIAEGLALTRPVVALTAAMMLTVAMLSFAAGQRARLWRLWLGFALSVGAIGAHIVQSGVAWPLRASGFVWIFPLLLFGLAMANSPRPGRRLLIGLALSGLIVIGGFYWRMAVVGQMQAYQALTRELAEDLSDLANAGEHPVILIGGQVHGPSHTFGLNDAVGFSFRLSVLTNQIVHICDKQHLRGIALIKFPVYQDDVWKQDYLVQHFKEDIRRTEAACAPHRVALAALPVHPRAGHAARLAPGVIGLRLPDRILEDQPP